jgi:WD40 repeat protein
MIGRILRPAGAEGGTPNPEDRVSRLPEPTALAEQVRVAMALAARRERMARLSRVAALTAAAVVIVVSVTAYLVTKRQRDRAVRAETAEAGQRQVAEGARDEAVRARAAAETARDSERKQKEAAEYDAYVATIGLVGSYIDNGEFAETGALLERCPPRYRNWEWGWLQRLRHEARLTVAPKVGYGTVAFAPDGKALVTGEGGDVLVLERESGAELRRLKGHTSDVYCIVFSRGGDRLATASQDKTARLWDYSSGREIFVLKGHADMILAVAFSPDGGTLVSASRDGAIWVWDAASGSGRLLARLEQALYSVAFLPDGKTVAVAGHSAPIGFLDVVTGKTVADPARDWGYASVLATSPDGRVFVTAHTSVTLRDPATGAARCRLPEAIGTVNSVRFSGDSKLMVTASSADCTARVWSVETGELVRTFRGHSVAVYGADLAPDGREIVTFGADGTVRFWDLKAPGALRLLGEGKMVRAAVFSPDGKRIALGYNDGSGRWGVTILDPQTSEPVATVDCPPGNQLAVSPDGRRFATQAGQGWEMGQVWEISPALKLCELKGHRGPVGTFAFLPDGQRLVTTGFEDDTIRIWDAQTGAELRRFEHDRSRGLLANLVLAPDGRRFLDFTYGVGVLRDTETGDELQAVRCSSGSPGGAFAADGRRLVVGDTVADATSGATLLTLTGAGQTNTACFSPDGSRIFTGGMDRTVRIWDAATGRLLLTLRGHTRSMKSVGLSADGRYLLSQGYFDTPMLREAEDWRTPGP